MISLNKKVVIITGCQGQDGSILSDIYLEKGWKVIGVDLWKSTGIYPNIQKAIKNPNFTLVTGEITDREFIYGLFKKYKPTLFYNMGAISLVPESFKIPRRVFEVNTYGVLNILEIIRYYYPKTRFYQASSSEQIGKNTKIPQNTESNMIPTSPYAVSKLASYHMTRLYREAYGLFCVNGLLWNHEGPRRGPNFVTRKITLGIRDIILKKKTFITLGYIDTFRDWGLADDYCKAMILMMEADKSDDYAVATGETHSIREFVELAFKYIGETIIWKGKGLNEKGYNQFGKIRIKIDKRYFRPSDVPILKGDYSKIKKTLGWKPKTKFKELVKLMMKNDSNCSR